MLACVTPLLNGKLFKLRAMSFIIGPYSKFSMVVYWMIKLNGGLNRTSGSRNGAEKMNVKDPLDMESNIRGKELTLWAMRREGSDISIKV